MTEMNKIQNALKNYYLENTRLENFAIFYVCIVVFYLLIYNISNYSIFYGYDADAHIAYVDYIAMYLPSNFKLPLKEHTYEYFSPPLPYLFPAIVQVICRNFSNSIDLVKYCQPIYGKFTQIFQTLLYVLSLFFYMKTLKIILNKKTLVNFSFLILISTMAVNYRTILMLRGEPYIIFFLSLLLYLFTKIYNTEFEIKVSNILLFSLVVGMLGISRQWGLLLLPSFVIILYYFEPNLRKQYFKFMFIVFIVSMVIIMPFYINLFFNNGSVISFNKEPEPFNFNNQPSTFYNPINDDISKIFTKPIRGNLDNQLFPILYSDLWGDYWGYLAFTSNYLNQGRNQLEIGNYLARVNIISLLPTFILVSGLFAIRNNEKYNVLIKYIRYSILITFIGYLWFLIKYPEIPSGDTIKSTYIIQMFHLIAFTSSLYLEKIKEKNKPFFTFVIFCLLAVFTHNISSMMSHF